MRDIMYGPRGFPRPVFDLFPKKIAFDPTLEGKENVQEIRPNYYRVKVWVTADGERREVELEAFDLIDALGADFYLGNAIKYLFRAGKKTATVEQDLRKTLTYVQQSLDRLSDG